MATDVHELHARQGKSEAEWDRLHAIKLEGEAEQIRAEWGFDIHREHRVFKDAVAMRKSLRDRIAQGNYTVARLKQECEALRSIETEPERKAREKAERTAAEAQAKLDSIKSEQERRHNEWNTAMVVLDSLRSQVARTAEVIEGIRGTITATEAKLIEHIGAEYESHVQYATADGIIMALARIPVFEKAQKIVQDQYKAQIAKIGEMAVNFDVPRDCWPTEISEKN